MRRFSLRFAVPGRGAANAGCSHRVCLRVQRFSIKMTRQLIKCLEPRGWLNDEVVNFYMGLLDERQSRKWQAWSQRPDDEPQPLKCYFLSR